MVWNDKHRKTEHPGKSNKKMGGLDLHLFNKISKTIN
jgi:hypothetical protein